MLIKPLALHKKQTHFESQHLTVREIQVFGWQYCDFQSYLIAFSQS